MDTGFAAFAKEAAPRLLRAAYRLTGETHGAEDLVQDTLIKVGLNWSRIRGRDHPDVLMAYAAKTLGNCYRSSRRLAWRKREVSTAYPDIAPASNDQHSLPDDDLMRLLNVLPPRQRATLILRFYLDQSEAQTASALRCSRGSVKSQTSRGLDRLRALMEQNAVQQR